MCNDTNFGAEAEVLEKKFQKLVGREGPARLRVYLASPYRHKNTKVMDQRYDDILYLTAMHMSKGYLVFSPIVYGHHLAVGHSIPHDYGFWEHFDRSMIDWADELWVATLDGWEESEGVQEEIKYALSKGMTVKYV